MNLQRVAILGSTGSIGTAALEVMGCLGDPWSVGALSTHSRVDLLCEQVERYRPAVAVVTGNEPTEAQRRRIEKAGTKLQLGAAALADVAGDDSCGTVLASVVGAAGLPAVLAAVRAGKRIALANKESLVVGGSIVMPLAAKTGAQILPVDSEHSAIFQAVQCGRRAEVKRVVLTASGGPFRTKTKAQIDGATAADALAHPTWRMGSKISIDSASMFNKAFELIEACWLFDLRPDEIEVVIHPQSIVHSMVEFVDGSVVAQLGPPDMKLPIQYALTYPHRAACPGAKMDWTKPHALSFDPPDRERFPAIALAYRAAAAGGTLPAVMNAANEVAVEIFLGGTHPFGAITRTVMAVMDRHQTVASPTLEELLAADAWARREARGLMG